MKITRKKHLEIKLQNIPPHPNPKVELEQYSTPASIASDLLWNALSLGDIENKSILDLGCGTGVLAGGCKLLKASSVVGVDIDMDSIVFARKYSDCEFIVGDVFELDNIDVNTIFQNPPFGSQKFAKRGTDLKFVEKAYDLSPDVLYSFHMASSENFLVDFYQELGFKISHIFRYEFPIPKIYDFHIKESSNVGVIVIRSSI